MSATVTQVANATVHQVLPDFAALTEKGHWGACGLIAEASARHACPWGGMPFADRAATEAYITQWTAECYAAGKASVTGVMPLSSIYWHLQVHHAPVAGYIPYSNTPDLAALHAFLKTHALAGNPVIFQVVRAYNLPHNESGVNSHFVVSGGIDSTLGYLIANGDTAEALTTNNFLLALNWATWATLSNAGICGAIALQRIVTPPAPTPGPTPAPVPPIGLSDALAAAHAALASVQMVIDKLTAMGG